MNTPSHALINCVALGTQPRQRFLAVFAGAFAPDVPAFLFYVRERAILGVPEPLVWHRDYAVSTVRPWVDALHSFPLILLVLGLALLLRLAWLRWFSLSLFLHSLVDLLVHHQDAHRHFFPLSDYRFMSPVSYWDPRYHGAAMRPLELAIAAAYAAWLWRRHRSSPLRYLWPVLFVLDLLPYLYW